MASFLPGICTNLYRLATSGVQAGQVTNREERVMVVMVILVHFISTGNNISE